MAVPWRAMMAPRCLSRWRTKERRAGGVEVGERKNVGFLIVTPLAVFQHPSPSILLPLAAPATSSPDVAAAAPPSLQQAAANAVPAGAATASTAPSTTAAATRGRTGCDASQVEGVGGGEARGAGGGVGADATATARRGGAGARAGRAHALREVGRVASGRGARRACMNAGGRGDAGEWKTSQGVSWRCDRHRRSPLSVPLLVFRASHEVCCQTKLQGQKTDWC